MTPKKRTEPDEWAQENRIYPPTSGVPGPRNPYLTPYVIAFERAVAARTHKRVVLVVGSQMGKSESMLDIIGQRMDLSPTPVLYLGPTKQFLQEQWEPRVMELIDQSAALRDKIARGKRMTKTRKVISGVPLRLAHGGSSVALKSDPFGLALTDEADELAANVKGQGDPISQVDRRGDTYADFVHAITSTPSRGPSDIATDAESGLQFWANTDPTEVESTIWRLWQSGTQYHWAWPCPHCGEYFIPRFNCLAWDKEIDDQGRESPSDPAMARRTAFLACPANGCVITNDSKVEMNRRGVYVAPGQYITPDGVVHGDAPESWTVSFWVSGLASPFKAWGERAAEYVEAARSGEPGEIQSVINGGFGELYAPGGGDVPDWKELEGLKAPYLTGEIPPGPRIVTAAVDVQKSSLYYAIRGWGARSESWLLDMGQIFGETCEEEVWSNLEEVLLQKYGGMPIRLALIDSGYRPGRPDAVPENRVYEFCCKHRRFCRPTKGRSTQAKPIILSKIEIGAAGKGGRRTSTGLELFLLDTDYFKGFIHERLRWPATEPGAFHLPQDVTDDYLKQLVSEARIRRPGGRPKWVRRFKDNHFFDCESMNAAAAWFLGVHRLRGSEDIPASGREDVHSEDFVSRKKMRKSAADWSAALNG